MQPDRQGVNKSKFLSWILRHRPSSPELPKDDAGWLNLEELLAFTNISREELEIIRANDEKNRIQIEANRIRACQGHSAESGVTPDALEASWSPCTSDDPLFHGTRLAVIPQIAEQGLIPGERTHVHCAPSPDSAVGKRSDSHVLLQISPAILRAAGQTIFTAPNGVILVRHVPPTAITGLRPLTKEARKRESELRSLFHIS